MSDKKVKSAAVRNLILDTSDDLVGVFLYYGRKKDECLPRGVIESAIISGDISVCEIVEKFRQRLTKALKNQIAENDKEKITGDRL